MAGIRGGINAVHGSGLESTFREALPRETFALPSAALVEHVSVRAALGTHASSVAAQFAEFWQANNEKIDRTLIRANELGRSLQESRSPMFSATPISTPPMSS